MQVSCPPIDKPSTGYPSICIPFSFFVTIEFASEFFILLNQNRVKSQLR